MYRTVRTYIFRFRSSIWALGLIVSVWTGALFSTITRLQALPFTHIAGLNARLAQYGLPRYTASDFFCSSSDVETHTIFLQIPCHTWRRLILKDAIYRVAPTACTLIGGVGMVSAGLGYVTLGQLVRLMFTSPTAPRDVGATFGIIGALTGALCALAACSIWNPFSLAIPQQGMPSLKDKHCWIRLAGVFNGDGEWRRWQWES